MKSIYAVIKDDKYAISKDLKAALAELGLEESAKSYTTVTIHSIPVDMVDKVSVEGTKVVPTWRGTYCTLAAQQVRHKTHQIQECEVKLQKDGILIKISD